MTNDLLKTEETAAYLRIAPHTLQKWRCKGQGPRYLKVGGGAVRYRQIDVEMWAAMKVQEQEERDALDVSRRLDRLSG